MRLYRLQINISLLDVGEMVNDPEQQEPEKNEPLLDPIERAEQLMVKAEKLANAPSRGMIDPSSIGNTMRLCETYEVPKESFSEAMAVLTQFHELANKIGIPTASGFILPMPFPPSD